MTEVDGWFNDFRIADTHAAGNQESTKKLRKNLQSSILRVLFLPRIQTHIHLQALRQLLTIAGVLVTCKCSYQLSYHNSSA